MPMFDRPGPRVFGLPPGADFAQLLVAGLHARMQGQPPESMAKVTLYVNATRMARRIREVFDQGPPSLLPQIKLVTDLADPLIRAQLPLPVPPLRRRLELVGLVTRLIEAQPDLAPRSAIYDLADSLAGLMEEMQVEDVPPARVATLDVSDQSGHWQRALRFLDIVQQYFHDDAAPDAQGFARRALALRLTQWEASPPQDPVIVAGSTGSRGTTFALMRAVARLPQGALVLPGFDAGMPGSVWDQLTDPLSGEDHPQFRFSRLLGDLGLPPESVQVWHDTPAPNAARNRLISLALRPAPVTHQWMTEGPALPDLIATTQDVTLIEALSSRDEALAIALRLREAAETGTTAALVTPDRMLTRQVTSALDRWGIRPDDSAGTPAQLTPPGRFLRHVAGLFQTPLTAEALLTLLKHPLTHTGSDRGPHLLHSRDLELHIRRKSWPFPQAELIRDWAAEQDITAWGHWLIACFCDQQVSGERPLTDWLTAHMALATALAAGPDGTGSGELWDKAAGQKLAQVMAELQAEAPYGGSMDARDYAHLFGAIVARAEVRSSETVHPHIRIWGTLEARVMDADLLILGGLNEGSWPEMPGADPWLNRKMRAEAGLLLPERRIGLSAHDFQQAAGGKEVWLTRSMKSDEAETVPSRWINRLMNLMNGLPDRQGPEALHQMRARGAYWLGLVRASEVPQLAAPAPRPSPAPPVLARPTQLSVTEIKRLVRDPYAIYAKHVLRLRPLDPLMRAPDALMRGIVLHRIYEDYVKNSVADPVLLTPQALRDLAETVLGDPLAVPFPTIRALWQARVGAVAEWFAASEGARQAQATPAHFEIRGRAQIPALGFTLTAQADRIDIDARGGAHIYDYKTGAAPTDKEQRAFDRQLLLEAAMVTQGAFEGLTPRFVERALFVSLKPGDPKEVLAPLQDEPPDKVWAEFAVLITAYADRHKGYTARRALAKDSDIADYDHLSRFGEWSVSDAPTLEVLE